MTGTLRIPARYCGPPGTGNGGYTAGVLASRLPGSGDGAAVAVTLRHPAPVDARLVVTSEAERVRLTFGGAVVAEAAPAMLAVEPVEPVDAEAAAAAESTYAGRLRHPFPTCFACGTDRPAGDGLGLRPGRLGDGRTACTWVPATDLGDGSALARPEICWAAMDCPGGWSADLEGRPMVLGRITARLDARPRVGEKCVVMGRLVGGEGRKTWTCATLYDADGRVLGVAEHTWIAVPAPST